MDAIRSSVYVGWSTSDTGLRGLLGEVAVKVLPYATLQDCVVLAIAIAASRFPWPELVLTSLLARVSQTIVSEPAKGGDSIILAKVLHETPGAGPLLQNYLFRDLPEETFNVTHDPQSIVVAFKYISYISPLRAREVLLQRIASSDITERLDMHGVVSVCEALDTL